jgi:type IX secretion system PorP/SprF family membrane protein
MRDLFRIALLLALPLTSFAQYIPHSGQNFQFAPVYNPAFSGIENYIDVKASHRYQWTAFKSDAPQFTNLAVNFRIKQPLDLKLNALRPSRTDFSNLVPRRKLSIYGLGFNVFNEQVGPIKRRGVGANFAIHMPLSDKVFAAGGIGAMYENTTLDGESLYWGEGFDQTDPIYQSLLQGAANHTELWGRVGVLVYGDNFYFGATYYPVNSSLNSSDIVFTEQFYQGNFQAGVGFPLNEDFMLRPSIWAIWQEDNSFLIDYTAKFYMQDKVWFGLTYRDIMAGVVSGGFNINAMFSASYGYEFPLGKLRTFAGGSHELVISCRFNNFKNLMQRTW